MISFIGVGRLGNFMFQTAAALAYSKRYADLFTVPSVSANPKIWPVYFPHLRNKSYNPNRPQIILKEEGFPYQDLQYEEHWRKCNILLNGYWQSEKYFKDYKEDILYAFGFNWSLEKGVVGIHVRRGDYLQFSDKHPPVTLQYLNEAIEMFPGKRFRFFSDDIKWCKENFQGDQLEFSEGNSELADLQEMFCCEHNIISNSSFSWWAAWLNQNPDK